MIQAAWEVLGPPSQRVEAFSEDVQIREDVVIKINSADLKTFISLLE